MEPTISNDTIVNFSVGLDNPGEFYEFTKDIVNDDYSLYPKEYVDFYFSVSIDYVKG